MQQKNFQGGDYLTQVSKRKVYQHPFLIMSSLYLGAFVGMFSETSLNIALPALSKYFDMPLSFMQWIVVGYMLVIGIILPLASFLMKNYSIRQLTLFSLICFLIGALISALSPNFVLLLAGRMIQGIGTGLILPMLFATSMEVFPIQKLGSAMGIASLIIMFAPAIGPTLAGILLGIGSWRLIFFAFTIILILAIICAYFFIESPFTLAKSKIDWISCILSALGFGGIILAFSNASEFSFQSIFVIIPLIIGLLALIFYTKRQLNLKKPILNLKALQNKGFVIGTLLVMLNFGITLSSMYLLPQILQNALNIPVALTGIIMLPGGIVNAVVSFISGKLYDQLGPKKLVVLGFILTTIGCLAFSQLNVQASIGYIIACHLLLMIGIPLAMSPAQSSALQALPKNLSTDGSTIINTLQQVLGAIATAITTCLLQFGSQQAIYPQANKNYMLGAHFGFYFALILAIIGLFLSFNVQTPDYIKKLKNKYQTAQIKND